VSLAFEECGHSGGENLQPHKISQGMDKSFVMGLNGRQSLATFFNLISSMVIVAEVVNKKEYILGLVN